MLYAHVNKVCTALTEVKLHIRKMRLPLRLNIIGDEAEYDVLNTCAPALRTPAIVPDVRPQRLRAVVGGAHRVRSRVPWLLRTARDGEEINC